MKNIIVSADSDRRVYSVPDVVAENLQQYCMEFCVNWLRTSPHAEKYRRYGILCYNEQDFIEYLNKWIFPDEQSVFVENLGRAKPTPEKYKDCPCFNF